MSSTNRGYERHKADYYITPKWAIEQFMSAFIKLDNIDLSNLRILDPCAGGSKHEGMSYPEVLINSFEIENIITVDIREDSRAKHKLDYLVSKPKKKFDLIITNPPFDIAMDIIIKALNDLNSNGYLVLLLRLNFFGSERRYDFLRSHMPKYCFVHHKRLNFIPTWLKTAIKLETGKSLSGDSVEYAHFVWQKDNYLDSSTLILL